MCVCVCVYVHVCSLVCEHLSTGLKQSSCALHAVIYKNVCVHTHRDAAAAKQLGVCVLFRTKLVLLAVCSMIVVVGLFQCTFCQLLFYGLGSVFPSPLSYVDALIHPPSQCSV